MKKFDTIIIGSGQAGTPLVFKLAANDKKVAFIEKEHFGGTCLNVGCTPTKTYVASARRLYEAKHGDDLGIEIPNGAKVNLAKVKSRKDKLIQKSVDGISNGLKSDDNITLYKGSAHFVGNKTIAINGEEITAEQIFINVGAKARIPKEYDGVDVLTNKEILQLEEIPEHLIIIGGSYIGLEFGQMFRRFGSKVTIIEKQGTLINREDEEVSKTIKEILENEGVNFRMNATCLSASQTSGGKVIVKVDCTLGPPEIIGSHLLLAVGRTPNTDTLNLDSTGVEVDERGFIKVNDKLETNVPGVFALGDCNGMGAFTHTAYNDYEIIAENMFDGKDRKISDRITTYGLFIDPPLGRAGLTLAQAKETGKKLNVGYRRMSNVARARERGETNGFMSVVIDADTNRILGASILGIGGDEIISSLLNIMYADQPYTVIRDSVQPHPTVSELIPTMLEGVREI
jgi:pyruvate/2-oxoglutarate dehydrogenase complex dihydrolipoamide dehydrogenase (E3) component